VVPNNVGALEWLRKHLEAEGSDLLREMLRTFAERLMAADVDGQCKASYGEVVPARMNSRNGCWRPENVGTSKSVTALPQDKRPTPPSRPAPQRATGARNSASLRFHMASYASSNRLTARPRAGGPGDLDALAHEPPTWWPGWR
jgi:Transposase, Mutator family